jgi:hypothetical protein
VLKIKLSYLEALYYDQIFVVVARCDFFTWNRTHVFFYLPFNDHDLNNKLRYERDLPTNGDHF